MLPSRNGIGPRRCDEPGWRCRRFRDPSNHDAFDLVDGHCVRCAVVELRRLRRTRARRSAARASRVPPFDRYAVIPVARNVWQHVEGGSSAAAARRLIIARTTRRCSARPVSRRPAGSTLWKSVAFGLLELGRLDVLVQCLRCPVVGRDVMPLSALLVEPEPPPAPLLEVVLPPPSPRPHSPARSCRASPRRAPGLGARPAYPCRCA